MFLISLILVSLIAIAIIINSESNNDESSELVAIPVRISETEKM